MSTRIRWGVVGSGGIARRRTIPEGLVPASNASLVSVFDLDPAANRDVAQRSGARPARDLDELLAADLDAVYVATPAHLHHAHVLACARAGKHVLCEKPLGLTVVQAEEMTAECRRAGVTLGTAFMMRFHAQHAEALALVRQGGLGTLCYGRAQLSCWYPPLPGAWRQHPTLSGGGSLMDMGGHCIDLLEMFLGPAESVACFTNRTVHPYASEDSAVALLRFRNGATATVDTFFCIPDNSSRNALELYGSRGSILAHGTIGQGELGEMTAYLEGTGRGYDAQQARPTGAGVPITPTPVNMYRAEIEAFSHALLNGCPPPCDAELGVHSQRVLAACYESAQSGRAVTVA